MTERSGSVLRFLGRDRLQALSEPADVGSKVLRVDEHIVGQDEFDRAWVHPCTTSYLPIVWGRGTKAPIDATSIRIATRRHVPGRIGGPPFRAIERRGLLGWAGPVLTHGGRAMGEYNEAFVAFDVARRSTRWRSQRAAGLRRARKCAFIGAAALASSNSMPHVNPSSTLPPRSKVVELIAGCR